MDTLFPLISALLFSAFFTGIEVAFTAANKLKIEVEKSKNFFAAKILSRFVKRPALFVSTLWLCNIISLIVYGIYIVAFLEQRLSSFITTQPDFISVSAEIIIASFIYLVIAEWLPRIIFRINPNKTLKFFSLPVYFLYIVFYPVIMFFIFLSEGVLKFLFRVKIIPRNYTFSSVDLDHFLNESASQQTKENNSDYQEIQMFQNARDLSKIKIRDCMVPRMEIAAISSEDTIENLTSLIVESGHSKILVFNQSVDDIIGYSHSYDIFRKPATIKEIIKPVIIVPETMTADRLLNKFIIERKSVALVVDEFGGTAGMLTIEDIIEEIFGEIDDEYDVEELEDKQLNEYEYLVSGRTDIYLLNEKYNLELPESDDYNTLAGYIIYEHESIPVQDEEIQIGDYLFIITRASETKIEQVLIRANSA